MRKFLSLVLALAMAMSLVVVNTSAKEFTDSDELNYQEAVDVISEIGVVDGYADGSFNPQGGLTRGAAAKIICNLILGPTTAAELHADTRPYPDVAVDSEFAGYIAYCAQQGIISGYADGEFKAANPLTGYAFMKMLLGALGYSSDIEQYVGENWSINVAKQAIGIGLNQGLVDEFNGVDYVTREEAALYAFNTLKATLVDYENTITADVNGASVTISNNTAKPVTWSEGINEDGNIWDDNFVQFAEEYFPDLERLDDDTKFMEPANTWLYDRVEIGTYERTDLLVETYTTGVSGRDIYDLLKAGVIRENDFDAYLDGVDNEGKQDGEVSKDDFVRSNTDDLGSTGNGVLTKIYLDPDANDDQGLITLVSINTWLAQATTDYSEANEYATLRVYRDVNADKQVVTANYNVDVTDVPNVVDVTKDTFYRVNISWKDNDLGEIVVLNDVEVLEDSTISEYSSDDGNTTVRDAKVTKLTTGGEEYSANEKAFYDDEILYQYDMDLLTDATYNVYLDAYGYFLGVDLFEGTQNYVFITGFDRDGSNLSVKTATATGIFLDGTMENLQVNISATDDNIEDARDDGEENADLFVPWSTYPYPAYGTTGTNAWGTIQKNGDDGIFNLNQWYTYTVNEAGVYTLKPCVRMTWTQYTDADANADNEVIIRTDNLSVVDKHPEDVAVGNLSGRVYGEDASVYLTVDLDVVDTSNGARAITDVNGVYTGVQSVDLIVNTDPADQAIEQGQVYTVFDSDGYIVAAVVIGEAQGATGNYAYVLSEAKSERLEDGTYYWTFDAIVEGEKQTLTARSSYTDTIRKLNEGDVVELRFDGDYVVNVKEVDKKDIYTNFSTGNQADDYGNKGLYTENLDSESIYLMKDLLSKATAGVDNTPNVVSLQRNTLYITHNRQDVGLGIARDAKAVVIQDENRSSDVVTNFSDVQSAVDYLVDPDPETAVKEYAGTIMAVINSAGAAEWVVFDSATPLTTGSDTGYGQVGNIRTQWADAYTWDGNADLVNELNLGGSTANGSFSLNDWGMLTATINYSAPQWVPSNTTVSLTVPVYYYNSFVGNATFTNVLLSNGKATMVAAVSAAGTPTPGEFLGFDVRGFSFGNVSVENFGSVNAYWFDANTYANLASTLTNETTAVSTTATQTIGAKMANNTATATAITATVINGTVTGTLSPTYGDLNSGWDSQTADSATVQATGVAGTGESAPVIITLNLSATQADVFTVTADSTALNANIGATAAGAVGTSATAQAISSFDSALTGATDKLKVTWTPAGSATTGVSADTLITFSVEIVKDATLANAVYDVVVVTNIGSFRFNDVLTDGPAKTYQFRISQNVTVSDVQVSVDTAKLAAQSVKAGTESYQLDVAFNTPVTEASVKAASFAVTSDGSNSVTVTGATLSDDGKTVTLDLAQPVSDLQDSATVEVSVSGNELTNAKNAADEMASKTFTLTSGVWA